MEDRESIRLRQEIIQGWTNAELVEELRNPLRALCGQEVYVPLLVEAMARLLERKKGKPKKENPFPRLKRQR
jgi:hypothetical protein